MTGKGDTVALALGRWFLFWASALLLWGHLLGAQGVITTIAGAPWVFRGDGQPAADASLGRVTALAVDSTGNVYAGDANNARIFRISPSGLLTVVAGNGISGYSGDGGPAVAASLSNPGGMAFDSAGSLYVSDRALGRVRKITSTGTITTIAGNGSCGPSGDGGSATLASLCTPGGLAFDAAGNLYVAIISNNQVRKVTPAGIITTVAGSGTAGFAGDGGPAISALLS